MPSVHRSFAAFFANLAVLSALCAVLLVAHPALAAEAAPQAAPPAQQDASAATATADSSDQQDSALQAESLFSQTYQACMDEAAGVTTGMQDCMNTEQERLETRLNAQRARVAAALTPDRAKAFNDALDAWDTLRKSGSLAMFDPNGGTLSPLMASLWYLEQTARMTRWVDGLQESAEQ